MELKLWQILCFEIVGIHFNRTNMELKPIFAVFALRETKNFNRTNMELKQLTLPISSKFFFNFNRTNMELKLIPFQVS